MIHEPLYDQTTAVLEPEPDIGDYIFTTFRRGVTDTDTQLHYKSDLGYNTQFNQERMA